MESLEKKPNNFQIWLAGFLKKYFGLVVFVFVLLLSLAAYYLIIAPKFKEAISVISADTLEQQKKYNEVAQKLVDLSSLDRSYKKIDSKLVAKVEEFLPSEYVQEQLFLELEQVIIKNGYTVNSITVEKELGSAVGAANKSVGRVKVKISVSSVDYLDFKKLLSIMESNVRLMDIEKLTFAPGDQTADFEFFTYYLKAN